MMRFLLLTVAILISTIGSLAKRTSFPKPQLTMETPVSKEAYAEPTGGSYDPSKVFKEEDPVNPYDYLDPTIELDHLLPSLYSPWEDRVDGELDPFAGTLPNEAVEAYSYPEQIASYADYIASPSSLFAKENYSYVPHPFWYVDVASPSQGLYPTFYDHWKEEYRTSSGLPGNWIDAVYSHGAWSYILNLGYDGNLPDRQGPKLFAGHYGLLAAIVHCSLDEYPYTIYFDDDCVYFMSKSSSFPNDYLDEFNARESMHLLYR